VFAAIGDLYYRSSLPADVIAAHPVKELYISRDFGRTWLSYWLGDSPMAEVRRIVTHPTNPDVLYFACGDGELYLTTNARAEPPQLTLVRTLAGDYVQDMAVDPSDPDRMLLITDGGELYESLNCQESGMVISDATGAINAPPLSEAPRSIAFNPSVVGEVTVGEEKTMDFFVWTDSGASWTRHTLPTSLQRDQTDFAMKAGRVYYGPDYAVLTSAVETFVTFDGFATFDWLIRTWDGEFWGHKGVGSPANINGAAIGAAESWISGQDLGVYSSAGADLDRWKFQTGPGDYDKLPFQDMGTYNLSWTVKPQKIAATSNGTFVIFNALKRQSSIGSGFAVDMKFFLSDDHGATWENITDRFPADARYTDVDSIPPGEVFTGGHNLRRLTYAGEVLWIIFHDRVCRAQDSSSPFLDVPPEVTLEENTGFTDFIYDDANNVGFLSAGVNDPNWSGQRFDPAGVSMAAPLYQYVEGSWQVYDVGLYSIVSLAQTDSHLIIGTNRSNGQPGYLVKVAKGSGYSVSNYKISIGDVDEEVWAGQHGFQFVGADGSCAFAVAQDVWFKNDRHFGAGVFISLDAGDTWRYAQ